MSPQTVLKQSLKSPQRSSTSDTSQQDAESIRGRKPDRDSSDSRKGDNASGHDDEDDEDQTAKDRIGPVRKRKRSRKGLDKKYHCPHENCGKSYSRAEHLYRHQLNHNPKQIYKCDFPECQRDFVRQDLCARHKERHTARGSHLQRKDNYSQNVEVQPVQPYPRPNGQDQHVPPSQHTQGQNGVHNIYGPPFLHPPETAPGPVRSAPPASMPISLHARSNSTNPMDDQNRSPQSYQSPTNVSSYKPIASLNHSVSDGQYGEGMDRGYESASTVRNVPPSPFEVGQRHMSFGSVNSSRFHPNSSLSPGESRPSTGDPLTSPNIFRPPLTSYINLPNQHVSSHQMSSQQGNGDNYISHQFISTAPSLPPPVYPRPFPAIVPDQYSADVTEARTYSVDQRDVTDAQHVDGTVTVFGEPGYASSPCAMRDDFVVYLFGHSPQHGISPLGSQRSPMAIDPANFMSMPGNGHNDGFPLPPLPPQQHPMAVTSIIDSTLPQPSLSEEKRQDILSLIKSRFNEIDHPVVSRQRSAIMAGNMHDESNVLGLRSLQLYIASYWSHFHYQMPILHQPTFSTDRSQNLLLLAVIAIGASCIDKRQGQPSPSASDLASFLAWHLRGEIFGHPEFRPPAKLWIFQALLLLEVYEKMYSTRDLHERAHIHHATTLTLMRRGRTLHGLSALDSSPSLVDEKVSDGSPGGAIADTADQWWNHWITNEATRRVAFAAFIIDSTHATMFGHSATMVAHEMHLPLPCNRALWSAMSGAEVGKLDRELQASGIKPIQFLHGLKSTLSGQAVRTNSFGRTALMAGLLSVSWHMNQRDMQVRSLGVFGGKDLWRGPLTKAFDVWEGESDRRAKGNQGSQSYQSHRDELDEESLLESRTVLHHLAHMAMHVDIVQCQIFAKATRLLGRTIMPADYNMAQRKMRELWAPRASAQHATFYALRFLSQVLAPDLSIMHGGPHAGVNAVAPYEYSAPDDHLLNRPWVLYFAALIVWSYGFALDGHIVEPPTLRTKEDQTQDMRDFLRRVGGVQAPEALGLLKKRNNCLGLLMFLRDNFQRCRWELLIEASGRLQCCISMLTRSST